MQWWSVIAAWRLLDQLPLGLDQTSSQLFSTQHVRREFSIDWETVDSQQGSRWSASKKLKFPQSQGQQINDFNESVSQRSSLFCLHLERIVRLMLPSSTPELPLLSLAIVIMNSNEMLEFGVRTFSIILIIYLIYILKCTTKVLTKLRKLCKLLQARYLYRNIHNQSFPSRANLFVTMSHTIIQMLSS